MVDTLLPMEYNATLMVLGHEVVICAIHFPSAICCLLSQRFLIIAKMQIAKKYKWMTNFQLIFQSSSTSLLTISLCCCHRVSQC